jgi:hypothetical protein
MRTALRVLIVKDSESDALRLVRQLEREGYRPAFERVDTPAAMRAALAARDFIVKGSWARFARPLRESLATPKRGGKPKRRWPPVRSAFAPWSQTARTPSCCWTRVALSTRIVRP